MEKILLSAKIENDFVVKEITTEVLADTDEMYTKNNPYVTHGRAERRDGGECYFTFLHNEHDVVNEHIEDALTVNELRLGFYLRKEEEPSKGKIITLWSHANN